METGWRHKTHEEQREFERIRRQSSSTQKASDVNAAPAGQAPSVQLPPTNGPLDIAGAINSESASKRIYAGVRLQSPKATINIGKNTTAADKLFVFQIDRPLTVEHNEVAVEDQTTPASYTDTVKFIDFKDDATPGGITWTVTNYDQTKIQVQGRIEVGAGDFCVYGENIGTYPDTDLPYSWYVDTVTDEFGCLVLQFKKFQVTNNDLIITSGTNSYLFDVNILGTNLTVEGESVYVGKSSSTLQFRGLRAGTNMEIVQLNGDPNPEDKDLVFNCTLVDTNTTYSISAETATGGAYLRLTDSSAGTDDVKFANGTGITVSRTDANTITIACTVTDTNNTYTLANEGTGHDVYDTGADLVAGSNTTFYLRRLLGTGATTVSTVGTRLEINSVNTTYSHSAETATGGAFLRLSGSDSSTDDVKFASGTGITVSRTDANTITITSTVSDTNTTYDHSAVSTTGGALLRLTGSDATTDDVKFASGTGITVTRTDADTITISCSVTDTDTTYSHSAVSTTGGAFLRLTGSDSSNDDVKFASGTGITVTRTDADTITIACSVVDTNTTYDHSVVDVSGSVYIRLHGSDSSNGDILFQSSDASVTITRIDANTIDLVASGGGGGGSGLTYDILAVTAVTGAKVRLHGSGGSTDDILLQSGTGISVTYVDDNTIDISCTVTDTNTTYDILAVTDANGAKIRLHGSDSSTDDVLLKEGTGISIDYIDASTIQISCTVTDTNTTYDILAVNDANGAKIRLHGSDSSTDDVLLKEGTGIAIDYIDASTIQISCTVTDTNTTYDTDVVDSSGVYLRLNGSDSTHSNTLFVGTGGITITRVDAHTISINNSVVDTNTTYDHLAVTHANGALLRLHGSDSSTDDILLKEGTGIAIDYIDDNTIQIACTITDTNTTYDHLAVTATGGAKLRLHGSDGSTDDVLFRGAGATTVTYIDDNTIEISSTDTNTTYDHLAVTATGGAKLRLHGSSGSTDDVLFRGAGATTVTYIDADTIEISSTDTNTTYDHLVVTATGGAKLRLHGSDSSTDDVLFTSAGNTVLITRTDDNTMNFEVNLDAMPYNVVGSNIANCGIGATPYNWYIGYDDDSGTHTRTLKYRSFQASHDLSVTACSDTYILDVNITIASLSDYFDIAYDKVGSQLQFRGLQEGTGITLEYIDDDPVTGRRDIRISSNVVAVTYDHFVWDDAGHIKLQLHGSDSSTDDVEFIGSGGTAVTMYDDSTIKITSYTYTLHFAAGSPAPGTGTSDKVILRLHESSTTDYDVTFREGTGIQFDLTGDVFSITGNKSSLSAVDGSPAPGTGTSDKVIIRSTNSIDGSTSDVTLVEGSNIVLTRTGNEITIAASSTDTIAVVDNCSAGAGASIWHDTTVSGSTTTYHLRKVKNTDGFLTITENTHDISFELTNPIRWYAYGDAGAGTYSIRSGVTGSGTYGSPYVFGFKTINAGNGILVGDASNILTIKTNFTFIAAGATQSEVSTVTLTDETYGIGFLHDTSTPNASSIRAKWNGYNTKWDKVYWTDGVVKQTDATLPDNTWTKLLFDVQNINDGPSWVHYDATALIPWYFKPVTGDDSVWLVSVRLFYLGRYPTSNTIAANVMYPEIALFIDDTHYQTLDVDMHEDEYGPLRQALLSSGVISSTDVPESGSKAWLHGTATVKLANNTDKLNIRFRHRTGSSRYIKLKYGGIDISLVGIVGALGTHPDTAPDFTAT